MTTSTMSRANEVAKEEVLAAIKARGGKVVAPTLGDLRRALGLDGMSNRICHSALWSLKRSGLVRYYREPNEHYHGPRGYEPKWGSYVCRLND